MEAYHDDSSSIQDYSLASTTSTSSTTPASPMKSRFKSTNATKTIILSVILMTNFLMGFQWNIFGTQPKTNHSPSKDEMIQHSTVTTTIPLHKPDGKLRILAASGCSGSSIITKMIETILKIHGYDVDKQWQSEIYRMDRNPMFEVVQQSILEQQKNNTTMNITTNTTDLDISIQATLLLNQDSMNRGKFTFFKWEWGILPRLLNTVGEEEVLYGGLVRENVLDRLVCRVQDCFTTDAGYTVYANNGTEAHLCFQRRHTNVDTKVHFYPDLIVDMLHEESLKVEALKAYPETETYEQLLALEYTDDDQVFENSFKAWERLIRRYVDVVDSDKIRLYLSSIRNTRKLSYHDDYIQNYQDVLQALEKDRLDHYWRKRPDNSYKE